LFGERAAIYAWPGPSLTFVSIVQRP